MYIAIGISVMTMIMLMTLTHLTTLWSHQTLLKDLIKEGLSII